MDASNSSSGFSNTVFEGLARNNSYTDTETLIEVLRSPVLLSPIAEEFNLNVNGLRGRIAIEANDSEGVLKVRLTGQTP